MLSCSDEKKVCRLCAKENPNCERLFCAQSHLDKLVVKMFSYISMQISVDNILPHWICPDCKLKCESTEEFFTLIRKSQEKLSENVPKNTEKRKKIINTFVNRRKRKSANKVSQESPMDHKNSEEISKRLRRPPKKYLDFVTQNKEMSLLTQERYHSNEKDVDLIDSELIAQVRSVDGTTLGEMVEVSSVACRNTTRWVCEICKEVYQRENLFLSHIATHKNFEFECTQCELRFKSRELFSQHQNSTQHVGLGIIEDLSSEHRETSIPEFPAVNILIPRNDQISSVTESSKDAVDSSIMPQPKTLKSQFDCSKCGKIFQDKATIKRHQKVHSENRPFKCAMCPASFKTRGNLENHISSHIGRKEFNCNMCDKRFVMKHALLAHERTHTKIKPFECLHCKKRFSLRSNLNLHERIHNGLKPYKCNKCDATFRLSSQLQKHRGKHFEAEQITNVQTSIKVNCNKKPNHICKECGKVFTQSCALTKHRRTHTGEKPYSCNLCPLKFSDPSNFRKHTLLHLKSSHGYENHENKTMKEMRTLMEEQGITSESDLTISSSDNINSVNALLESYDFAAAASEQNAYNFNSFQSIPAITFSNELIPYL